MIAKLPESITVSAPGKMILAGEWAVLEKNCPCLVAAVDYRVKATIKESKSYLLTSKEIGAKIFPVLFEENIFFSGSFVPEKMRSRYFFLEHAYLMTARYLREKKIAKRIFALEIKSGFKNNRGGKLGFGSSAAVTAAAVAAILAFHGVGIQSAAGQMTVFKLASLAHYLAQGKKGSCFDVAASTFGGLLLYEAFDQKEVLENLARGNLKDSVKKKWPSLIIKKLTWPPCLRLIVGDSGQSASSPLLISRFKKFRVRKEKIFHAVALKIRKVVLKLMGAIKTNDEKEILRLIRKNRRLLQELAKKAKINLETRKLKLMADSAESAGLAGKFSGAGGGDIGFAACFSAKEEKKIRQKWRERRVELVPFQLTENGLTIEKRN